MQTRTYCAPTMAAALADVKRDLGRDAVIVHTRNFRKGGLLGIGGRAVWEITASAQMNVPRRLAVGRYVPTDVQEAAVAGAAVAAAEPAGQSLGDALSRRMGEIHGMVSSLLRQAVEWRAGPVAPGAADALPVELAAWRTHLLRQEVGEQAVAELMEQVARELPPAEWVRAPSMRERLVGAIASRMPAAGAAGPQVTGRPRVMVLIGPTGVGKTTTIAKLAARFKLADRRKVGLITIDTYRIAAVDQLKTYAQILEVPLRTVLRPGDLAEAVAAMADLDVVLIDTAGRSPADSPRLGQMRAFLEAARADEVHLVVSATAGAACATRVLESFGALGANRWILSKLDEAGTFGMALNIAREVKVAMSFVTTGQEVPDDIAPADPRRVAELIVGEGPAYGG